MRQRLSFSSSLRIAALCAAALLVSSSSAQAREDGAPASALGMGDAVRSNATGTAGLYFNPAGMGMNRQYAFEAGYSYDGDNPGHAVGASAVDSKTNPGLAMGIGYTFITAEEGGGNRSGHRIRGGLAAGHTWDSVALRIGVGAHYLNLDKEFVSAARPNEKDPSFLTIDAGVIVEIARVFRLGVVGQNLIDTKSVTEAPRRVGFGIGAIFNQVELNFDTDVDLQTALDGGPIVSYAFGTQALLGGSFVARSGFTLDNVREQKRYSAGLGYVSKAFSGDVAISKRTDRSGGWLFSVGMRMMMP